jgi:hypothetical protein
MRRLVGVGIFWLYCSEFVSFSQHVEIKSGFIQDSIAIGEPAQFYLTARYPYHLTILFPDSLFRFAPFEYISKRYFPTKTNNGLSYDSVVYQIRTFEITPLQSLHLSVFIPLGKDSLHFKSPPDTIKLITQVKTLPPDTIPLQRLPLKTNTDYRIVRLFFNYPILVITVTALLISLLLIWIFFGKKIKKYLVIRRLQKDYTAFMQAFSDQLHLLNNQFNPQTAENSVSLWKKYLEKLEAKPYTKLTTREVLLLSKEENLHVVLKSIDSVIYGNQTQVVEPLKQLQVIAKNRFHKKLEEVKFG